MTLPMPTDTNVHEATFEKVHDGDTATFWVQLTPRILYHGPVRFARVNAPELKTIEGQTALNFTTAWFAGGTAFVVRALGYEKYGRLLCEIWRKPDGANISDALLATGNAVVEKLINQLAPLP